VSFFLGDWWRRGLDRLPLILEIQRRCLSLLLQPDWLGFWIVLAALTAVAVARRHGMELAVIAIVWIQVIVYELTAVFTYLPPLAHLEASFFRICAALVPIGLLGMAMLSRRPQKLAEKFGSLPDFMTQAELRRMREEA
jgi:ammonia channel protein AmtB